MRSTETAPSVASATPRYPRAERTKEIPLMRVSVRSLSTVLFVLLAFAGTASAQVDRATLTGIVRDPSDAVIAKAQVKVTSLATNAVSTATTTTDGTYLVVNLPAGEYLVQVEAP